MAGEEKAPVHCNTQQKPGNTGTVDSKRKKKNKQRFARACSERAPIFISPNFCLIICSNAAVHIRTFFLAITIALFVPYCLGFNSRIVAITASSRHRISGCVNKKLVFNR